MKSTAQIVYQNIPQMILYSYFLHNHYYLQISEDKNLNDTLWWLLVTYISLTPVKIILTACILYTEAKSENKSLLEYTVACLDGQNNYQQNHFAKLKLNGEEDDFQMDGGNSEEEANEPIN